MTLILCIKLYVYSCCWEWRLLCYIYIIFLWMDHLNFCFFCKSHLYLHIKKACSNNNGNNNSVWIYFVRKLPVKMGFEYSVWQHVAYRDLHISTLDPSQLMPTVAHLHWQQSLWLTTLKHYHGWYVCCVSCSEYVFHFLQFCWLFS